MAHPPGTSLHLIADLIVDRADGHGLGDAVHVEQVLRTAASAARATIVGVHLHHFGPGMGLTAVAMLAESHISIHTWPEAGVAAVDLFVCGIQADAEAGLQAIVTGLGARVVRREAIARLQPVRGEPVGSCRWS